MASVSRSGFSRVLVIFMFACGGLLGECYGLPLLVAAFNQHGSPGGNTLFFIFGLVLLVVSAGAFVLGVVVYWKLLLPKDDNG
jgi:hypothetical protein